MTADEFIKLEEETILKIAIAAENARLYAACISQKLPASEPPPAPNKPAEDDCSPKVGDMRWLYVQLPNGKLKPLRREVFIEETISFKPHRRVWAVDMSLPSGYVHVISNQAAWRFDKGIWTEFYSLLPENVTPAPSTPGSLEEENEHEAIQQERAAIYGHWYDNHQDIASMWTGMLRTHFKMPELPDLDAYMVALMMAAVKLNRASFPGGKSHWDSYKDAAIYCRIAQDISEVDAGVKEKYDES